MTQEKWADTPLSQWIRARMAAEGISTKRALAARLRRPLKITQDSAERQVTRWTVKHVMLDQRSRSALRAVLKEEPPDGAVGGSPDLEALETRLAGLEQAVALIERRLSEEDVAQD